AAGGDPEVSTQLSIETGTVHPFDEVKALDLHHLGYDFVADVEIGKRARREFTAAAAERRRLLLAAMEYLDRSGQSEAIADLPVDDIAAMTRVSRELVPVEDGSTRPVLRSRIAALREEQEQAARMHRSKASSLDAGLVVRVQQRVDAAVAGAGVLPDPGQEPAGRSDGIQHE
ncbi:hypothetical protein M707_25840, partial [Arthrobacter sp. AK-YN10]